MPNINNLEVKPSSTGTTPKPDPVVRPAPLGNVHTHSIDKEGVSTPESANKKPNGK